jgi:hypothetical protein
MNEDEKQKIKEELHQQQDVVSKTMPELSLSEEMKQEAIKSMNLAPSYLKEYELFLTTE